MVNKTLKKKVQAKPVASKPVIPVVESMRDVWFAGLGVFSVAQQEGENLIKQGGKLFDKLVSEGAKLEKKSRNLAESAVGDLKSDVETRFEGMRNQATENWDSLGNIFDERVSGTLERLGIPTNKDLHKLSGHVQDITRKATNSLKEFESLFEKRVSDVLNSLRIPRAEDLDRLSAELQTLSLGAAENLANLDQAIEKRVSTMFGKLETTTNSEIKKLNSGVQDVSRQVAQNLGKLEGVVEKQVIQILNGLGLPSRDDIQKLSTEMQALARQVAALEKNMKVPVKKATARKPAKGKVLAPKATTTMTVAERKKAAEAIARMKPAPKAETTG